MLNCANCLERGYFNTRCSDCRKCPYSEVLEFEYGKKANVIINRFGEFTEIVCYKDFFQVPSGVQVNKEIDRSRKFITDSNGVIVATKDGEIPELEDINNTIYHSGKRAKDNFYGYAFSNDWEYFLTATIDPKRFRTADADIRYCWQKFRQRLQYLNPEVKILCAPERHQSGVFHFHSVISNIDFTPYMTRAVNAKTGEFMLTQFGDPIFNLRLWDYGITTLVKVGGHGSDRERVANYLISYTTKENSDIGYNKKRYFRTHNLAFKEKEVSYYTRQKLSELLQDISVVTYKENERMIVFRKYEIPEPPAPPRPEHTPFEDTGRIKKTRSR